MDTEPISGPVFPANCAGVSIHKTQRRLPHWTCDAAIYWITFRLMDSLPQDKLKQWQAVRTIWLRHNPEPWDARQWREYRARFGERLDDWLDAGYGSRALALPDIQAIVRDALLRFEGTRLSLHAGIIMPNHVHLVMEPLGENKLNALMKGIKGASAHQANQCLGRTGQFWIDESFDHIVRSEEQYHHFVEYIVENPIRARLQAHEYWVYQNIPKHIGRQ